jgi:hypothetical protein
MAARAMQHTTPMKKKTRRQMKKVAKSVAKAVKQLNPGLSRSAGLLAAGGATAGGLLLSAALDPRIQQSAKELASALADFLKRNALGDSDQSESSLEHH